MPDFRKLQSPKSRAESKAWRDRMVAFQGMGRSEMAASLLVASRTLVDAGLAMSDMAFFSWRSDDWMLNRCIPALALCLNPGVKLREDEIPRPVEGWDPLSEVREGKFEGLLRSMELYLGEDLFRRARFADPDTRMAAQFLLPAPGRAGALGVAIDRIQPGLYPARVEPDTRAPLEGAQLIASHGDHDRVERYAETAAELEELFQAAVAKRTSRALGEDQEQILRQLRSWPERLDFDALSIQSCDGTVLQQEIFVEEPDGHGCAF